MKLLLKITTLSLLASMASTMAFALANPASVNCLKEGGTLKIVKDSRQNEYGLCQWPATASDASSECEEWALLRGKCKKGACASWKIHYDSTGAYKSLCGLPQRIRH